MLGEATNRAYREARRYLGACKRWLATTKVWPSNGLAAPSLDLDLETSSVPVWNDKLGRYELALDQTKLSAARDRALSVEAVPSGYVVRPFISPSPDAIRPKILHIIPNVHVGGSTQLIIDIIQHTGHEFEHHVLTSALWRGQQHDGMPATCIRKPDPKAMRHAIARLAPEIVHIHYWGLSDDPWYRAAFEALDAVPSAYILENINTPIAPMSHPRVNHYVYVSEFVRTSFSSGAHPEDSSSVIYPGIDLSRFSDVFQEEDARNAIGMVYRLEDDKLRKDSINLFIEVARLRPRTKIYIVGGGSFLGHYVQSTIDAGVRNSFQFTGYVSYDSLPDWYNKFAVFVAPVWKESFGQVVPFAMGKGLAVAGYEIGALPEILGTRASLAGTVVDAAAIIVELLDNPDRLAIEGMRNRERAMRLFSVDTMIEAYRARYLSAFTQETAPRV